MNKADGQGTRDRLSAIVANSLDTGAKMQDLARQAYQSRTQFHRLFRTVIEETPAAMRGRLYLSRAVHTNYRKPARELHPAGSSPSCCNGHVIESSIP